MGTFIDINDVRSREFNSMKNKRLYIILGASTFLLLYPFIAMQLTDDVNWTAGDFLVAGTLLYGTSLTCEFVLRRIKNNTHRFAICTALLAALFFIFVELGVGIFGATISGH